MKYFGACAALSIYMKEVEEVASLMDSRSAPSEIFASPV